jgi:hypothetical protein
MAARVRGKRTPVSAETGVLQEVGPKAKDGGGLYRKTPKENKVNRLLFDELWPAGILVPRPPYFGPSVDISLLIDQAVRN